MKFADFQQITPTLMLHEVCDILWKHSEYPAYRALRAYIIERDNMLECINELSKEDNDAP